MVLRYCVTDVSLDQAFWTHCILRFSTEESRENSGQCESDHVSFRTLQGELVKCVVNHNPNLGNVKLPSAPRDTSLRVLSATFCGLVEIPVGLIRPEMFVKV